MALTPGTRLGPYEIISAIGAGGMGEVYRATDTKLNRDVALKILPEAFASDPDRLARFTREAQTLASLNHPNIAAIYGIEESGGTRALVMELVDGSDLSLIIARRPMPLADALPIAKSIAEALEAAHELGIVHRDLKPANIKVRADGTVKVLDFGLAKATDPTSSSTANTMNSPTITTPAMTMRGVILGTAAYMAPEQARGKPVDKRADIWAFGCVLYEMLTGLRAFAGETTSDTIAAILEREPDWTRVPSATPAVVVDLLQRCLDKNPKRRLRDIGDARLNGAAVPAGTAFPGGGWTTGIAWGLVAVLAVALAWSLRVATRHGADVASSLTMERITYDAGLSANPAVSKDGRLLVYASDRSGRGDLDIWIQQTSGGAPLRVTDDPSDDQSPDLSPDGSTVVFRSERNGGGAYLVSAFGGEQRLLAPDARGPKFAPDGARVAYYTGLLRGGANGASKSFVLPLSGGEAVRVLPAFEVVRDPVWAPDGQSLLVVGRERQALPGTAGSALTEWWWAPLDGRAPVKTTTFESIGAGVPSAWDASGVVFSQGNDLWLLPVSMQNGLPMGPARRLTTAAQRYGDPAVTKDGDIVFTAYADERVIERAPLPVGAPVTLYADSRPDTGRSTQTREGTKIVFERGLTRGREIWLKDVRTGRQRMVLHLDDPRQVDATVSPDGARIAYTARGIGFVVEADGGVARRLCEQCQLFGFLSDNRRVLAVVTDRDYAVARVISTASSSAEDLLRGESVNLTRLHASPDDQWLAFQHGNKSYLVPLTPGHPPARERWMRVDEPTTSGRPCGWSLDSRVLYLLLDLDGFRCLYGQRVEGLSGMVGQPAVVRHFHDRNSQQGFGTGYGDAISTEGFLYEGHRTSGNLWRLVLPRTDRN